MMERIISQEIVAKFHKLARTFDINQFIKQVVWVIHNQFSLYAVNLFLLEDSGKWAVLRLSTGEIAQVVLERGHKLAVDGDSLTGEVFRSGQGMSSSIPEEEQNKPFQSAIPPPVHSELVVPLRTVDKKIIGVLDILSSEYNAFDETDMLFYQSIANEVANLLVNNNSTSPKQ